MEKPAAQKDPSKKRRDTLDRSTVSQSPVAMGRPASSDMDARHFLPPVEEIIEALHKFKSKYFQLGFLPTLFPERLRENPRARSAFWLLSLLSIAARYTPSLIRRYGNGAKSAEMFMEQASSDALNELYQVPTLERCQAFYMLSIAQQGSGYRNKSYLNLGIAIRMAALMRLHREETYALADPLNREAVIKAESARRTLVSSSSPAAPLYMPAYVSVVA